MSKPPVLDTVLAALLAVSSDKLSSITYTATHVHVHTMFGSGTFSRSDWEMHNGPLESIRPPEGGSCA